MPKWAQTLFYLPPASTTNLAEAKSGENVLRQKNVDGISDISTIDRGRDRLPISASISSAT